MRAITNVHDKLIKSTRQVNLKKLPKTVTGKLGGTRKEKDLNEVTLILKKIIIENSLREIWSILDNPSLVEFWL